MTVSSTTRKAGPFVGNGVTTVFPFVFKVFAKSDVKLLRTDSNGVSTTLTLDSDYSIALNSNQNSNPGGSITYPINGNPLPAGSQLIGLGDLEDLQPTDITNSGGFYPSVIEDMVDRATIQIQQLAETTSHALQFPPTDSGSPVLVSASARAGTVLGFDDLGNVSLLPIPASVGAGDLRNEYWADGTDFTAGTSTSVALSRQYGTKANLGAVVMSGVTQSPKTYSLNGATLTFTDASGNPIVIPAGTTEIWCTGGTTLSTTTTPDESVTDAKLAPLSAVYNRITDIVDARDPQFAGGARGDGVTDDTVALQAALNYVAAIGGTLYIPRGTYLLNTSYASGLESRAIGAHNLTVNGKAGFRIIGDGIGATKLTPGNNGNLAHILYIFNCSQFEIGGIEFVGNNTGRAPTLNNGGLFLYSVNNFYVHDIKTSVFQGSQIVGDWWFNGRFERIYQNVPVAASGYDVAFLQNITIDGHEVVGGNGGQGFQLTYDPPNADTSFNLTGVAFNYGISNGIRLLNGDYTALTTPIFINETRDIWIDNNNLHDNLNTTSSFASAIGIGTQNVGTVADNINITRNKITNNGSTGGTAFTSGGIFLNSAVGRVNVRMRDNQIFDNATCGIVFYGTNVAADMQGNLYGNVLTSQQILNYTGSPIMVGTMGSGFQLQQSSPMLVGAFDMNNQWSNYTPTVSVSSGALTTYNAAGRYKRIGQTCHVQAFASITNNGTGAGIVSIALPFPAAASGLYACVSGQETASTGKGLTGTIASGASSMNVVNYDNTYAGGTGHQVQVSATYEVVGGV